MSNAEDIKILVTSELEPLEKFAGPGGQQVVAQEGAAAQVDVANVVSTATRRFSFRLRDGDVSEQTATVRRPAGAGFIVMLIDLQYAFVNRQGGTLLRERPLGEFIADVGLRGDNLVCRVRLTDINADDPVSIDVTGGVLFFN